jgi:hypothetical protein
VEAIADNRAARARAGGAVEQPSVFAHEMLDPSGASLRWLEERGVRVERGCPTWGEDFLSEDELSSAAAATSR